MCKMMRLCFLGAIFTCMALGNAFGKSSKKLQPAALPIKEGRIIFVNGSCSAGKSSIAKILAKQLNAQYFAFDERVMPKVLKKFIKKHYGSFLAFFINGIFMRDFFSSVDLVSEKKKYAYQKKFYKDLQEGLAVKPTSKMYRDVRNVAKSGQDVIVESPLYLWDGVDCLQSLSEFDGADISYVLAYCPWLDVVDHLLKRNTSPGSKKNQRELDWVVINFMCNFDVEPQCRTAQYLEYLSGGQVHDVLKKYSDRRYKKDRMFLCRETQLAALQKFPHADVTYYVYPRFTYDLIVNTKEHNPSECADLVLKFIEQKKQTMLPKHPSRY